MGNAPLNTFAIISFRLGNEASTVKYEKYDFNEANRTSPTFGGRSLLSQGIAFENDSYNPFEKVYWIIFEDGHLDIEAYLTTTLFEQIENPFARTVSVVLRG